MRDGLTLLVEEEDDEGSELYSVSQKKSTLRFSEIFSQTVGNF